LQTGAERERHGEVLQYGGPHLNRASGFHTHHRAIVAIDVDVRWLVRFVAIEIEPIGAYCLNRWHVVGDCIELRSYPHGA
jgi:hypothetical protein